MNKQGLSGPSESVIGTNKRDKEPQYLLGTSIFKDGYRYFYCKAGKDIIISHPKQ